MAEPAAEPALGDTQIRPRDGMRTVYVPAGQFEAIKVSCQEVNRSKTWYYAPALGSHVYYLNIHRFDGGVAEELVAFERAAP